MVWLNGPVGLGAESRVLRVGCRTVLVVVPFVVAGTRLMDVLPLLEADHRLNIVFTVAPDPSGAFCHGAEDFIRSLGGFVLPWPQALRTEFDLILAASETGVNLLRGKVLLLPHGSAAVNAVLRARSAGPEACPSHALDRERLTCRGRLVPSALILTHESELAVLRESCPEALPVAVVAGDICYDRLLASGPFHERYRQALGIRPDQKLVTVTSTWRPESALGQHPNLLDRLLNELPGDEFRVAAILHPNIWSVHGTWQVRAWLADCLRAGLLLLPPEEGWRGTLVASDAVIGDHGSVTHYAAAIGIPVILAAFPEQNIRPDSVPAVLHRNVPFLRMDRPLSEQIRGLPAGSDQSWQDDLARLTTSCPGRAGILLRQTMYNLLNLPEPARAVPVSPVPLPEPITSQVGQP